MLSAINNFQINPHFICRVSGLPTDRIENLKSSLLQQLTKNFFSELKYVEQKKNELSQKIYLLINTVDDKKIRNRLINLKREIYNEKVQLLLNESNLLSLDILDEIASFKELLKRKIVLAKELKENYNKEKQRIRCLFAKYLLNDDFQKGLLLSSKILYSTQKIYQKSEFDKHDRKNEQIERGLLRYFSRTSMKATPFGTFCAIIPGKLNGTNSNTSLSFSANPLQKKSLILINKDIYGIISNFIRKDSDIRKKLSIELNKTIDKKETIFYFLTEIEGKEIFQRLEINPVLELLKECFEKQSVIVYEELVNNLVSNEELETTKEEVESYIDKLIGIGFIRFKIGIPEQMVNWQEPLIEILKNTDIKNAGLICGFLEKIQGIVKNYEINNVEERVKNLEEIAITLENAFKDLNITANIRSDLPLYEDATADSSVSISENNIKEIENSLFAFIRKSQKLSYPRTEHANMRQFFNDYYKDIPKEISLLQFYEDYYREHLKAHLEKQQKFQYKKDAEELKDYDLMNPFKIDLIKEIQVANKNISMLISKKWLEFPDNPEINISCDEYNLATENVKEIDQHNFSVSLFSQLLPDCEDQSKTKLILTNGHYLSGFGKYFSRFLYLFDPEVIEGIYEANSKTNGEILAEISGDANFNANLHPPLLKYEISYPTSEIGLAEIPLKCTDIIVEKNPNDINRLRLKDKAQNSYVVPLDLGFLNPMMRPPLFQLLSKFSPPSNFALQLPERPININETNNKIEVKETKKENGELTQAQKETITCRPRILFDNKIVLSRRSWFIPKSLMPQISNEESDFEYFIRVNRWREENNIPDEVYIRVRPLPVPNAQIKETKDENKENKTENENKQSVEEVKHEQINEDNSVQKKSEPKNAGEELKEENKTGQTEKKKAQNKFSRDYYKPQYIDFFNPLLVDLFGKICVGLKNYIVTIEERYPDKEYLPSFNGQTFAYEQIFQVDFKNKN